MAVSPIFEEFLPNHITAVAVRKILSYVLEQPCFFVSHVGLPEKVAQLVFLLIILQSDVL